MSSVNKVILVGHCGQDPEIRYTPSGNAVANVSLATSEKYKDRSTGENREQTEWHRLVFFGKLAEIVGQYVTKGSQLYVEGKIRTRKWTDQNTGQDRYTTEIVCDQMRMLGGKSDGQGQQQNAAASGDYGKASGASSRRSEPVAVADLEDDIPF